MKFAQREVNEAMTKKVEIFDWAKAFYELALDQSSAVNDILLAANLDPKSGDLIGADFSGLDFSEQDMSGWDLTDVNLTKTILRGTNLVGAKIDPASLIESQDWRYAILDDTLREQAILLDEKSYSSGELSRDEYNEVILPKPNPPASIRRQIEREFEELKDKLNIALLSEEHRLIQIFQGHINDILEKYENEVCKYGDEMAAWKDETAKKDG